MDGLLSLGGETQDYYY